MTDQPRFTSAIRQVETPDVQDDASWIESYIARAGEQIDFDPVKRRIRNRKLAAIEAETLRSDRAVTKIVTHATPFIALLPIYDPWEDKIDEA